MKKVLVCGGRDYSQKTYLRQILDAVHDKIGISSLVHGCAGHVDKKTNEVIDGADELSGEWARLHGITEKRYPANWKRYGKAAGPLRNTQMLECENPDIIIAFPGGEGTKNMVEKALAVGKDVLDVKTMRIIPGIKLISNTNKEDGDLFS